MGEIIRMIVVLSMICGLSGLTLATLRDATAERIVFQELTFVQGPAIEQVFPAHDNDPVKDRRVFTLDDGAEVTVFPALENGSLKAVAFETKAGGYGGDLGVMVGFDLATDSLSGIGVTTMKETPGVGSRVTLPSFTGQFAGHGVDNIALAKNDGDIDAVSGATISSTAAVEAVGKAAAIYQLLKPELETAFAGGQQ